MKIEGIIVDGIIYASSDKHCTACDLYEKCKELQAIEVNNIKDAKIPVNRPCDSFGGYALKAIGRYN